MTSSNKCNVHVPTVTCQLKPVFRHASLVLSVARDVSQAPTVAGGVSLVRILVSLIGGTQPLVGSRHKTKVGSTMEHIEVDRRALL